MGNTCINEYVDDLIYNASTLYENYIGSFGEEDYDEYREYYKYFEVEK